MTKRLSIVLLVMILAVSMMLSLVGCNEEYGSIPFKLKYGADNSIARLTGDKTGVLASNPDRGFSIDLYMTLDNNNSSSAYDKTYAFPLGTDCKNPDHFTGDGDNKKPITTGKYMENQLAKYKDYNPRVVVLTVFLTNFIGKDIPDASLNQIKFMLTSLKNKNLTAVIKFAYQHGSKRVAPSVANIVRHMDNLKKYLKHDSTIDYTVSAFRLSFIGEDGNFENHGYNSADVKTISNKFADMVPVDDNKVKYNSQVYNVDIKNDISEYSKLLNMGFYNDIMNGQKNNFTSGGIHKNSDRYRQYVYQSQVNYNSAGVIPNKKGIDGKAVLRAMKDGYFSTLDISRMYNDPKHKSLIDTWKSTKITKKELKEMNLPYYDEWFLNEDMKSANRTVFEYLRDFLGYNLSVTNFKIEKKWMDITENGKPVNKYCSIVTFTITNYGMAAPVHINQFEVFAKNNVNNARIVLTNMNNFDPMVLKSGGQINFRQIISNDIDISVNGGVSSSAGHSIGIKIGFTRGYSNYQPVRLNNDIPYSEGINWIYDTRTNK